MKIKMIENHLLYMLLVDGAVWRFRVLQTPSALEFLPVWQARTPARCAD